MKKREMMKWRETYVLWESPCLGEGLHLHVHFDEKDDVKRLGARWNPAPADAAGHWWMPKTQLDMPCPLECEILGPDWSGTIEHWLNNHKMIAGQHGRLSANQCLEAADMQGNLPEKHHLLGENGDDLYIEVYEQLDVVRLKGNAAAGSDQWLSTGEARSMWALLMQTGYRKTIDATSEVSA